MTLYVNGKRVCPTIKVSEGGGSPVISSLNVTPTTSAQTITAPSGTDGYSPISVSAVTSSIDNNITAGNIKKDVSILGITGTYEGSGGSTKYGATVNTFLGDVDANGTLQIPNSNVYLTFNGVKKIRGSALTYRFCVYNSGISGISNVTGVSFPDLETLESYSTLEKTFYGQDSLAEALFPKLANVPNNYNFQEAFAYCDSLERVEMPSLVSIPQGSGQGFDRAFYGAGIKTLDLRNLTSIAGYQTFYLAFGMCRSLTTLNMPNLTSVTGKSTCYRMFDSCGLTTFTFEKLSTVTGSQVLTYMFNQSPYLTSLYFPALTSTSFGSYTNQFNNMLYGVTGCTVHFPSNLQSVIGSWSDVTSGFGGTSTTVLFDLPATT